MFGNGKKTIGVFVQQVNEEYQNILCKGISSRAKELDYNVAIFTNFGGYSQEAYDNGERAITKLPIYEELDGIIIAPDTMHLKGLEQEYHRNIINNAHCPVVSVRIERPDYYNVLIDNDIILEEIITHFIEVHKFTRINFLSGPKDHPEIERRLECYKRVMQAYNLPVEEDRIYYGDLWKYAGHHAVEHWLNSPLERPQAIVCANDFMAATVCKALADRGISVPEDIAVSGCDDMEEAEDFNPAITSVRQPTTAMGKAAVDKIHRHALGEKEPKNTYITSYKTIFRASCGCKKQWYHETSERKHMRIASRDTMQNEIIRIAQMSTDLTGVTNPEDAIVRISGYWFEYESISHFLLCLTKDWNNYEKKEDAGEHEEIIMKSGFRDKQSYDNIKFKTKDLIPPELVEDRAMTYYFAPLHYREHSYGYIGFSFMSSQTNMMTLQPWLNIVSSVMESVRVHMEMQRLLYRLEDMSIRDELTGLYNRRVLDTLGMQCLKQCAKDGSTLMIFIADMDKLKSINDNFGHAKGDIAIRTVADALMEAAEDDEICIRLGGDEFMAIGIDYNDLKAIRFANRFVEEINKFNNDNQHGFEVYVSYGWNLVAPDENTMLESCLSAADSHMYQQKYNKVANNIKANLVS